MHLKRCNIKGKNPPSPPTAELLVLACPSRGFSMSPLTYACVGFSCTVNDVINLPVL